MSTRSKISKGMTVPSLQFTGKKHSHKKYLLTKKNKKYIKGRWVLIIFRISTLKISWKEWTRFHQCHYLKNKILALLAIFWLVSHMETIKTWICRDGSPLQHILPERESALWTVQIYLIGYISMRRVTRFVHCATVQHSPGGLDLCWIKLFTCALDILRLTNINFEYCLAKKKVRCWFYR